MDMSNINIRVAIRGLRQEIAVIENQLTCKREDLFTLGRTARIPPEQNSREKPPPPPYLRWAEAEVVADVRKRQEIALIENRIACKKQDLSALERTKRILDERENSSGRPPGGPAARLHGKMLATVPVGIVVREPDVRRMLEAKYLGERFPRATVYKVLRRSKYFEKIEDGFVLKSLRPTGTTSPAGDAGQAGMKESGDPSSQGTLEAGEKPKAIEADAPALDAVRRPACCETVDLLPFELSFK